MSTTSSKLSLGEKQRIHDRIAQWEAAAPTLRAAREEDIRNTDTREIADIFDGLLEHHGLDSGRTTSGLVEMQRYFRRLRSS